MNKKIEPVPIIYTTSSSSFRPHRDYEQAPQLPTGNRNQPPTTGMNNSFGRLFRLTTFGESHGPAVGAVIDGCPAGVPFDLEVLVRDLSRRRPGQAHTTARNEADQPEVVSGVFEGYTTGAPIAILVRNSDQRSSDYEPLRDLFRPSHADFTYTAKYGVRDHRGGGRSSARETLARVAGGAVARMLLSALHPEIAPVVSISRMGPIIAREPESGHTSEDVYNSPVRCVDPDAAARMGEYLEELRAGGDSTGGIVAVRVDGVPPGLGEPIYGKANSRLAEAMLSINGAMGFEMGAGFAVAERHGSANNDPFINDESGALRTASNNSGGVQGGITNGMPVVFRVAFKPPSSIAQEQQHGTVSGGTVEHMVSGRHDPSIVVRAVPVVEAMTLLVLADLALQARAGAGFRESGGGG